MASMMDGDDFNSGFIIVKPTMCSISIWNLTRATISYQGAVNDQAALNHAVRKTHGKTLNSGYD
jgi:Nucleotide-diphospho-sugar transferase